jgi:hypothetical protein
LRDFDVVMVDEFSEPLESRWERASISSFLFFRRTPLELEVVPGKGT